MTAVITAAIIWNSWNVWIWVDAGTIAMRYILGILDWGMPTGSDLALDSEGPTVMGGYREWEWESVEGSGGGRPLRISLLRFCTVSAVVMPAVGI